MQRLWLLSALLIAAGGAGAQADRTDCVSARSVQDRATCQREAAAARAEARRGTLGTSDEAQRERNALARCEAHTAADDRDACERRVRGEGTQQGSVAEGGILRELVLRRVEPAASAASAP